MKKINIQPDIDLQNSREYYGVSNSRDFYKGKSFNFAQGWAPGINYYNDSYIQDFVAYRGTLLACHKSHLSSSLSEPKLLYNDPEDSTKPTGVDSPFWEFVFSGTTGATGENGQVYVPEYNESTGFITWVLEETPSQTIPPMYVKGEKGEKGDKGDKGDQGNKGDKGDKGDQGIRGFQGEKGEKGDKGDKGDRGVQGIQGEKGNKGDKGDRGDRGPAGTAATIRVDSVITGDPGSQASIVNVGTASEAAFRFTIPRGQQGVQGIKGDKGDKGDTGEQGPKGKQLKLYRDFTDDTIKWGYDGELPSQWTVLCYMDYLRGVSIDDVDITDDAHLKVTLSSGHYTWTPDENGNPIKDENGNIIYDRWIPSTIITKGKAAATLTAGKVEMLQPGEDPKIENVGTIKDPIWDFYIPRGFTGEHAVHVGPEDPVTFRNSHLDDADIQEAYKNAEQMIWVDTKNKADFDHLNAVYHAYKEAGGTALDQSKFAEAFANLTNASGFSIKIVDNFEALGEPTKEKQNIIWLVPASQTGVNDLYEEYIVVKAETMLDTYLWEKWGSGTVVEIINSLESDRTDAALSAAQGKALKTLVDDLKASVAAALDYKGTKDTYDALPTEGNKKGDVWNVVAAHGTTPAGTNYAWDGTQWDPLGGTVDLSGYYTKTQVDDAISTAKTELETADTALEGQITTVTNQLNNKVDKVEGSGLISDTDLNQIRTNKSDIESLQTSVGGKQDELTPGNAVSITEENVIDVKLDPASNEALSKSAEGLKLDLSGVKGSTVKVGVAITGGAEIGADQTIAAGMQALSDSIQTAVSGGITSLTSPDETITVTGTGTSRGLAVNISKLVSTSSAIQIGEDGKLDMFWMEIE